MPRPFIKVNIKAASTNEITKIKTPLLAVGIYKDLKISGQLKQLDTALKGWLKKVVSMKDFDGSAGAEYLMYTDGKIPADRVLLLGLGEKKKLKVDGLRSVAKHFAQKAVSLKVASAAVSLIDPAEKIHNGKATAALVQALCQGSWKYDELIAKDSNPRKNSITYSLIAPDKKELRAAKITADAQQRVRAFANQPPNVMYPMALAAQAKKIAAATPNLTCRVYDFKQLKAKKMNGIIAVGQGAEHKPCMMELKYSPPKAPPKSRPVIGLVGKAITFDAGGISIKPSQGMQDMKMDMGGGVAVLGAIEAIAKLKLPIRVNAFICSAENMPGGSSYRPGDIITTYSGKTVEIQNTDAEGRMVMSDGIEHARRLKCDVIIDVATLTGACMVALGKYKAGLFTNDDKLKDALLTAAKTTGEAVWPLPCGDEYTEEMKSEIADLKNIGSKLGGACTAASFLREFAGEDKKWAHLDIAGPGMYDPGVKSGSGSRAFGVFLLTQYVRSLCGK